MLTQYPTLLTFLSASALPLLAILAILLRRNLFQGRMKMVILVAGFLLLMYTVFATFVEHGDELGLSDVFVGGITALITIFILSRFSHGHTHRQEEGGAKGIVVSEAFHSLIDGAVIGATYLVSPLLGGAATVGILIHELPKIVGTLAIFRGLGLSIQKTVLYGILAQIGSPVAAVFIFMLGKQIDAEKFHALEIASVSSLGAIVLWIIWLELRYHREHKHRDH
jgi:zinc and cadmium transporter